MQSLHSFTFYVHRESIAAKERLAKTVQDAMRTMARGNGRQSEVTASPTLIVPDILTGSGSGGWDEVKEEGDQTCHGQETDSGDDDCIIVHEVIAGSSTSGHTVGDGAEGGGSGSVVGEPLTPLEVTTDTGGPAPHEGEGQEEREADEEEVVDNNQEDQTVDNAEENLTVDNAEEDQTFNTAERITSQRLVNVETVQGDVIA